MPLDPLVIQVWIKGRPFRDFDPALLRLDAENNLIRLDHYGNRKEATGWEIDHIDPAKSGTTLADIDNLRPLQWEANVRKSDSPYIAALARLRQP